jgi:6-pyruvoyltetrahydropterin/6-carboxytetrahydropterin synthase
MRLFGKPLCIKQFDPNEPCKEQVEPQRPPPPKGFKSAGYKESRSIPYFDINIPVPKGTKPPFGQGKPMSKYTTIKQYGHERGLSCAFRQWRAQSHCNKLHGYSLAVKIEFECEYLDERNWGVDFGNMQALKAWLDTHFDHKTLVANDDPWLEHFREMARGGIIDLVMVRAVGCEAFAEMIWNAAEGWLVSHNYWGRVLVKRVEVWEHGGNGAAYEGRS